MSTAVMTSPMTASEALVLLDHKLSLDNIRMKLADPEEGKGYGPEYLDLLEQEYRRFLAMHLAHPEADIVPCKIVDEMWHAHILDTIAYRDDCDVKSSAGFSTTSRTSGCVAMTMRRTSPTRMATPSKSTSKTSAPRPRTRGFRRMRFVQTHELQAAEVQIDQRTMR